MFAAIRKYRVALLLVACHALAVAAADGFDLRNLIGSRSPAIKSGVSAALLIAAGADLGLLSLWLTFGSCRPVVRLFVTAICVVGCCRSYAPRTFWLLFEWSYTSRHSYTNWHYYVFLDLAAIFGLALLTIAAISGALGVVKRRGAALRRWPPDELQHEAGRCQFRISHLLLLTAAVALMSGFSLNARTLFSRQISMQWRLPAEAPIYSAETVFFSALCLTATTLTATWAVLGVGRPWLRLAMAWATASLLGGAWAFAFTSPRHEEFLPSNAAFSSGVALLQAVLMTFVLLMVRRRGYRFASDNEDASCEEAALDAAADA